jgi:hypothetical protein
MVSERERVIQWLYRESFSDNQLDFSDVLITASRQALRKSQMEAEIFATVEKQAYWRVVLTRFDYDKRMGRHPVFVPEDTNLLTVRWQPYILHRNGDTKNGNLLRTRPYILRSLDGMSDRDYERSVCAVLEFIGTTHVHLTPHGNEGGVDFYALLNCDVRTHIFGQAERGLRLVGQVKKYGHRETITNFNSFITTLSNVRHFHEKVKSQMPGWFIRGTGPIIGWYICHMGFQSGVIDTARQQGIILSDSLDLSQMTALSETLNPTLAPQDRSVLFAKKVSEMA